MGRSDIFKNTINSVDRGSIEESEAIDAYLAAEGIRRAADVMDLSMRNIIGLGSSATGSDQLLSDLGSSYTAQTFAAAGKVKISAANAADTSAGTGARTVRLTGIDANYAEIYEDITLNGQTEVLSTKDFLFVHTLEILTAGSGGTNAGLIYAGTGTVTSGVPATKWLAITAGLGVSKSAMFVVPAGYTLHAYKGIVRNNTATNVCTVSLFVTNLVGGAKSRRLSLDINALSAQDFYTEANIPEKTLIQITGNNATSTSVIRAALTFRLIKN